VPIGKYETFTANQLNTPSAEYLRLGFDPAIRRGQGAADQSGRSHRGGEDHMLTVDAAVREHRLRLRDVRSQVSVSDRAVVSIVAM
jgi:hypothetical protein